MHRLSRILRISLDSPKDGSPARAPMALFVICCLLPLSGCTSARRPPTGAVVQAPAPIESLPAEPSTPPPSALPPPVTPPGKPPATALEVGAGKRILLVESDPPGATIVVNGRPVGKAPVRISVKATPQGFFEDYLDVRARFVAASAGETSHTVEQEFTPREKVPASLYFTPEGAERTAR